jgi:porin
VLGVVSEGFEYGGRLDSFVKLDTVKLGLWKGGGVTTHLEYRFGALAGPPGGIFSPTNAAMEFPSDSPDTLVVTSLYLSQRFGDRASLAMAGCIVKLMLESSTVKTRPPDNRAIDLDKGNFISDPRSYPW